MLWFAFGILSHCLGDTDVSGSAPRGMSLRHHCGFLFLGEKRSEVCMPASACPCFPTLIPRAVLCHMQRRVPWGPGHWATECVFAHSSPGAQLRSCNADGEETRSWHGGSEERLAAEGSALQAALAGGLQILHGHQAAGGEVPGAVPLPHDPRHP